MSVRGARARSPDPGVEAAVIGAESLLSARQVQLLLRIDRSTVYRMAEDGRLPAVKVGRQWRFPLAGIERLTGAAPVSGPSPAAVPGPALAPVPGPDPARLAASPLGRDRPGWVRTGPGRELAESVLSVASPLLGVMMLMTDLDGHPLTSVLNPCDWFSEHSGDPGVMAACTTKWRALADDRDFGPRFRTGEFGVECARAFVRSGTTLVGMVLAGGLAPETPAMNDGPTAPGLYRLSGAERERALAGLSRVATVLSHVPERPGEPALP